MSTFTKTALLLMLATHLNAFAKVDPYRACQQSNNSVQLHEGDAGIAHNIQERGMFPGDTTFYY